MYTIFYTISISLFDSLSTTQQIIVFVLLLATAKPLRNSLSYLAGLSVAYFMCGAVGYMVLDKLHVFLNKYFPSSVNMSNLQYYQLEFIMGVIMIVIGVWYFSRNRQPRQSRTQNIILAKLKTMNGWFAFCVGVFISITSFPVSMPYLIALGKYSTMHLKLHSVAGYILLYNFGYAFPMLVVLAAYLTALRGTEDPNDILHEKARALNLHLTTWTFVGFGILSMVDAGCYFGIGHALIKGRYF